MKKPEQLSLPLIYHPDYLRHLLESATGSTISLTITDNTSSVVSVKKRDETTFIRLHRMFLGAGSDVIGEIVCFIRGRKGRTPFVREFVRENSACLSGGRRRRIKVKTLGKYYDLNEIYRSLNAEYFGGRLSCPITWGAKNHSGAVRRRTLGSYSRHTNAIRINPVLDRKSVPSFFIRFVVYHEMLHADMDIVDVNDRRLVHTKEFRFREKEFGDHDKAIAWEKGEGRIR